MSLVSSTIFPAVLLICFTVTVNNILTYVNIIWLYFQVVDRLDEGAIPADLGPLDYKGLYKCILVSRIIQREIMSKPEHLWSLIQSYFSTFGSKGVGRYMHQASKRLLLITNSDYHYTDKMMRHSFNKLLPKDMGWRELFDIVMVSARKPEFFQMLHPLYEVVTGYYVWIYACIYNSASVV
ncbi:HAD-superfamily hydrolase, subfamily IG, 5'-nucleotidase, putative [Theobroma cacao]|uniref:HAD-superfamily hydrolase, subfamily IG, 5'-nucleotidase, putative n=1 Tax=Theobroma cacao TaxID=3641 RepID=A0A061GQL5_THECC|nr:HAD-superfamily hydrolase, subfamily IG, 5'-nucleotidase, putative [Theobroma cacao]